MNPVKGKIIRFTTAKVPSNKLTGKKPCYRGIIKSTGAKGIEETADDMVSMGCDCKAATIRYVLQFFADNLADMIVRDGCSRRLGDLATVYPTIGGAFATPDADADPEQNPITLGIRPAKGLRKSLKGAIGVNVSATKPPKITSVFADGATVKGVVETFDDAIWPGHNGEIIGERLTIDPEQGDEGIWLVPGDGGDAVQATVQETHAQQIVFSLPKGFSPKGGAAFTLELRTRAGRGGDEALYTLKRKVTAKK